MNVDNKKYFTIIVFINAANMIIQTSYSFKGYLVMHTHFKIKLVQLAV